MKLLTLILALLLSACTTVVPVTAKFPEPPGLQAQKPCPNLKNLEQNPQLSDVAKTITVNYTEYYSCAIKVDAWTEWYAKQKIIFEGLGK
jgi:hypothetical protein